MVSDWNEIVTYYIRQGAPGDQSALISLLKEVQEISGGSVPLAALPELASALKVKETYLTAIIRRIPSLRLGNTHLLEVCSGPNCGKSATLAAYAEKLQSGNVTVKFVPCMRMCGKGPNIKWDGVIHHGANIELLQKLLQTE